jgi:hypothetical protein
VPMVCTADTFPHPAPWLAKYEPMSKNRRLHILMPMDKPELLLN